MLTANKPHTDNCYGKVPTTGFEIWAHAQQSNNQISYGGYGGMDKSGAGILAGLNWDKIHNPNDLDEDHFNLKMYWIQINNMLHELGHIFGAALGEYYSHGTVEDTTKIKPKLEIRLENLNDSYWKNKSDFKKDPMLGNIQGLPSTLPENRPKSRKELLETVQYSNLTAAIINGEYRFREELTIPDLNNLKLRVIDKTNSQPIPNTKVKIFSIDCSRLYDSKLLIDNLTNESGELIFGYGSKNPFTNSTNLRLIKAYKQGHKPQAKYISAFDLQEAKLLHNQDKFTTEIYL